MSPMLVICTPRTPTYTYTAHSGECTLYMSEYASHVYTLLRIHPEYTCIQLFTCLTLSRTSECPLTQPTPTRGVDLLDGYVPYTHIGKVASYILTDGNSTPCGRVGPVMARFVLQIKLTTELGGEGASYREPTGSNVGGLDGLDGHGFWVEETTNGRARSRCRHGLVLCELTATLADACPRRDGGVLYQEARTARVSIERTAPRLSSSNPSIIPPVPRVSYDALRLTSRTSPLKPETRSIQGSKPSSSTLTGSSSAPVILDEQKYYQLKVRWYLYSTPVCWHLGRRSRRTLYTAGYGMLVGKTAGTRRARGSSADSDGEL
ncbi:hypothetical protein BC629DRAFT_1445638 [Irpex lacteus]|nr:hypothetical protein BC629DRAFT_1445638 [Irpex lacteus]